MNFCWCFWVIKKHIWMDIKLTQTMLFLFFYCKVNQAFNQFKKLNVFAFPQIKRKRPRNSVYFIYINIVIFYHKINSYNSWQVKYPETLFCQSLYFVLYFVCEFWIYYFFWYHIFFGVFILKIQKVVPIFGLFKAR